MRKAQLAVFVLLFLSFVVATASANTIYPQDNTLYSVTMWANFTATQPCESNCSQTIAASFMFYQQGAFEYLIQDSLIVSGDGLLGRLSTPQVTLDPWGYTPWVSFLTPSGDLMQIMRFDVNDVRNDRPILMYFMIWGCYSEACVNAFGSGRVGDMNAVYATYGESTITMVPEPSSLALLLIPVAFIGIARSRWRWL